MNYRVKRIIVSSSNKSDLFDVRSLKTTKYVARKDPFERTNSHVRGRRFTSSCPRHGVISLSSEWEPKEGTQQQWRRDLLEGANKECRTVPSPKNTHPVSIENDAKLIKFHHLLTTPLLLSHPTLFLVEFGITST